MTLEYFLGGLMLLLVGATAIPSEVAVTFLMQVASKVKSIARKAG